MELVLLQIAKFSNVILLLFLVPNNGFFIVLVHNQTKLSTSEYKAKSQIKLILLIAVLTNSEPNLLIKTSNRCIV